MELEPEMKQEQVLSDAAVTEEEGPAFKHCGAVLIHHSVAHMYIKTEIVKVCPFKMQDVKCKISTLKCVKPVRFLIGILLS